MLDDRLHEGELTLAFCNFQASFSIRLDKTFDKSVKGLCKYAPLKVSRTEKISD